MMAPYLEPDALRASSEAIRVLVSPLSYPSEAAWRAAIHDALRTFGAADHTMSIIAGSGELVRSEDVDESVLRSLRAWFDEYTPGGRVTMTDPLVNEWNDRRRAAAISIYTRDLIDHVIDNRVKESPYVNEALLPNRIRFWQGVYGRGPAGSDAILWMSYARPDREPHGEAAIPLLSLLAPAFQAGLDALGRLGSARAALDASGQAMIVFDATGREIHRTPEFVELATRPDEAAALVARSRSLAETFRAERTDRGPPRSTTSVSTAHGPLVLRLTALPEGLMSPDPAVAVMVRKAGLGTLPDVETLTITHRLTRREAEVALELARGATREQVAATLGISPHTARAHTEKVFAKLGVTTRSAVASAILDVPRRNP